MTAWEWTTTNQEFKFFTKDIVVFAWDGKDTFFKKSGDKITYDPICLHIGLQKDRRSVESNL
jgi:hypothetical protein